MQSGVQDCGSLFRYILIWGLLGPGGLRDSLSGGSGESRAEDSRCCVAVGMLLLAAMIGLSHVPGQRSCYSMLFTD